MYDWYKWTFLVGCCFNTGLSREWTLVNVDFLSWIMDSKRSPLTLKNCVPELPTFGAIAGFSLSGVQWKGLDLGRSPFFIMVLPVPCKYDSYSEGRLRTKFYDDFNFPIVNFPFICSNIPVAYGGHIYQLIR